MMLRYWTISAAPSSRKFLVRMLTKLQNPIMGRGRGGGAGLLKDDEWFEEPNLKKRAWLQLFPTYGQAHLCSGAQWPWYLKISCGEEVEPATDLFQPTGMIKYIHLESRPEEGHTGLFKDMNSDSGVARVVRIGGGGECGEGIQQPTKQHAREYSSKRRGRCEGEGDPTRMKGEGTSKLSSWLAERRTSDISIKSWCEFGAEKEDAKSRGGPGATVARRSACSPPTKAIRVQSPAWSIPDFRIWESCRTMPLVGGSPRVCPVSPAISFRRCSILTSITHIGSQDLDVKSRPNLFTHSLLFL
ncbi:hypothetical protein PR048_007935 [Dryococelus australis]|uniref:Uncharacterized protein n=1 Tax=Dryococelus australis TaxID=614101 RepID=A0ABQ9HWK5_9NEOP|nr:hypothetical protein PR048_007935 [Dryococelus australis]